MGRRPILQSTLETLLGTGPSNKLKVYFQPKTNTKLDYPCITYQRDQGKSNYANNGPYKHTKRYSITVIDPDPDSPILEKLETTLRVVFQRHFATDNLNHDIYSLYF